MILMLVVLPEPPSYDSEEELRAAEPAKLEPTKVYALRFFESEEGAGKAVQLAKRHIRKNFDVDPKTLAYEVYEPRTARGGWPKWLGDAAYYT